MSDQIESVTLEAHKLVKGARQQAYGSPREDFKCTTTMFNAFLKKKYPEINVELTPEDGIIFMVLVKLSREANQHKVDNLVDGCGYLECLHMAEEEKSKMQEEMNTWYANNTQHNSIS